MGKHRKRSKKKKFFPVVDQRISERSIDPMTETVMETMIDPIPTDTLGSHQPLAAEVGHDLEYDEKDVVMPKKAVKQQISQHTRSEERARKNGHKPSHAKKMQKAYTRGTRNANSLPRLR